MAETTRKGRPKKTLDNSVEKVETKENDQSAIIAQLMAQLEKQNEEMQKLKMQVSQQPQIVNAPNIGGKKIKCVNLMHNTLNISTQPYGEGRVYTFEKYGDSKLIKFDDLSDIVSSYPNTMEKGCCYICDKDAVVALGLEEEYAKLYDKELMDKIVWLKEESDLDMFLGMCKELQESTAVEIAKLINLNETIDLNYLRKIKEECDIDIENIAQELKDLERKPTDEE